jgi:hypothetical protein
MLMPDPAETSAPAATTFEATTPYGAGLPMRTDRRQGLEQCSGGIDGVAGRPQHASGLKTGVSWARPPLRTIGSSPAPDLGGEPPGRISTIFAAATAPTPPPNCSNPNRSRLPRGYVRDSRRCAEDDRGHERVERRGPCCYARGEIENVWSRYRLLVAIK